MLQPVAQWTSHPEVRTTFRPATPGGQAMADADWVVGYPKGGGLVPDFVLGHLVNTPTDTPTDTPVQPHAVYTSDFRRLPRNGEMTCFETAK